MEVYHVPIKGKIYQENNEIINIYAQTQGRVRNSSIAKITSWHLHLDTMLCNNLFVHSEDVTGLIKGWTAIIYAGFPGKEDAGKKGEDTRSYKPDWEWARHSRGEERLMFKSCSNK